MLLPILTNFLKEYLRSIYLLPFLPGSGKSKNIVPGLDATKSERKPYLSILSTSDYYCSFVSYITHLFSNL